MGQYFIGVNETKCQWIHPHRFGDGMKFREISNTGGGFMAGLALLLRRSGEGGTGDWGGSYSPPNALERYPVVGSWAGDSIALVGDYDKGTLYVEAQDSYRDVSFDVMRAMVLDHYSRARLLEAVQWRLHSPLGDTDPEEKALYEELFRHTTFQERHLRKVREESSTDEQN